MQGWLALALILCMMCGTVGVQAAWDGYQEESDETSGETVTVVDMNNIGNITATVAAPSTKIRGNSLYSARWTNHTSNGTLTFNTVPRDWSRYETVDFTIYSAAATGAKVTIVLYCDYVPSPGTSSSYWQYPFYIDWTGWKTFSLNFTEDFTVYNQANLSKVTRLSFSGNGWGATPDAKSDLYFDSIVAHVSGADMEDGAGAISGRVYTSAEKKAFTDAMTDSTALFTFSPNVFSSGETKLMDADNSMAKTTTLNGAVMTPAALFTDTLGGTLAGDGPAYQLSLDGHTLSLQVGDTAYTADGTAGTFPAAPYLEGETLYLPAVECAAALGKQAGTHGLLTVIGTQQSLDAIEDNPNLVEVGGYMIANQPINIDSITSEDFDAVKENWRRYLVGDETNDISNEMIAQKITNISSSAQAAWDMMNKNEDATVLFGTNPVVESADMGTQYRYLNRMALGYGTYGGELYHNKKLKADILYGLEWLYEHLYGQAEIDGTGWRSIHLYNWWDWYVNVPNNLTEILMILEPEMKQADIEKYLSPFDYIRTVMRTQKTLTYAQSRLYVVTAAAVLEEDAALMQECMLDFDLVLQPATGRGDGVHEDYVYLNHAVYPLIGMYGTDVLLQRLVNTASILAGTKFEITSSQKYNQALWMYNTFDPVMYNGSMFASVNGRVPESGEGYGRNVVKGALDLLGSFSPDDDLKMKQIIRRHVTEKNLDLMVSDMNIKQIGQLLEVLSDDTLPESEHLVEARMYYNGDRAVQQRPDYAVSIAMSSERIGNYECINGVNTDGWYQGDGMLYVYTGDEYKDPYGSAFWNNANPYHMPGTTEDTQERKLSSYSSPYLSPRDFVGGVEFDDTYITAAMDFEAFHNDVPPTNVDVGYGGDFDLHNNDLVAKKSWFLFDDEIVALGAGINSTTGFDVQTVVDNRLLKESYQPAQANVAAGPEEYAVVSVTASGDDGNIPQNAIDGDYATRWSFEGTANAYLTLELEEAKPIGYVGIAQYGGVDGKQAIFKLEVSEDGQNWTQVFDGMASGTTEDLEAYDCKGVTAKYIRYNGAGRTNSQWNSVTEFKVFAPQADGQLLLPGGTSSNIIYGSDDITIDGTLLPKTALLEQTAENPSWVHLEHFGGYFFPQGGSLSVKKENNQNSFLELWLNHGKNPANATYAYAILPNLTADETQAYVADPDFEILSNTEKVQVVRERDTGLTGIVFWEAGSFGGITVTAPMVVMVQETDDAYVISMADPTQKLGTANMDQLEASDCNENMKINESTETVTIAQALTPDGNDGRMSIAQQASSTIITVNFEQSGKTVTARFRK